MNVENANKEFEEILDVISKSDDYESIVPKIKKFYETYDRHNYSCITKYIEEKYLEDEQSVSYLLYNIKVMIIYVETEDKDKSQQEFVTKLNKLYDHVLLEQNRMQFSKASEDRIVESSTKKINKALNDFEREYNKKTENLNTNMLTIIGLFSAIIFVFFGGINSLSQMIAEFSKQDSKFEHALYGIFIIGIVLFNVVFLLLYSISKMTDKPIGRNLHFPIGIRYPTRLEYYCEKVVYQYGYINENKYTFYKSGLLGHEEGEILSKDEFKELKKDICKQVNFLEKVKDVLKHIANAIRVVFIILFYHILDNMIIYIKRFPFVFAYNAFFILAIIFTYIHFH